jgi:hypothetical protein
MEYDKLALALSAYRANPTKENRDVLHMAQEVQRLREQLCGELEAIWER